MCPLRTDDRVVTPPSTPGGDADASPERGCQRWLLWFSLAVIVGMQAGTIFKPLGSIGDTRVADWIDLVTPYAVLGTAAMVLDRAAASRRTWVLMFVAGVTFTLGHGLHLAANSISNVADKTVAHASIVHLWDEVASHYIWYIGLYLVLVALWSALVGHEIEIHPLGYVVAVLVAVALVNILIEGDVAWMGLAMLGSGVVAGAVGPKGSAARLASVIGGTGFVYLATWGIAWYLADGRCFPEFSDVGWI